MRNIEEIAAELAKRWFGKTLEDFRIEAEKAPGGVAFESVRAQDGRRFITLVCIADIDEIARVEQELQLVDDNIIEDWNTLSLADLVVRTFLGGELRFESRRDEFGRRSALVLIAADPRSIRIIERLFVLPN